MSKKEPPDGKEKANAHIPADNVEEDADSISEDGPATGGPAADESATDVLLETVNLDEIIDHAIETHYADV